MNLGFLLTEQQRQLINQWIRQVRIIDGGFGTEAIRRSQLKIEGHDSWSSRLLKDDPNLVLSIHESFLQAGCDIVTTNTYQAVPATLSTSLCISIKEAEQLMKLAVRLAKRAVANVTENCLKPPENSTMPFRNFERKFKPLIAGSLGSYGACQADGSEYTGIYPDELTVDDLMDFHRPRAKILLDSGVDLLAWETVPSLLEVKAIAKLMAELNCYTLDEKCKVIRDKKKQKSKRNEPSSCRQNAVGWISVASSDGQTLVSGESLCEVREAVHDCPQIFGLGVNCHIPHSCIGQALANLNGSTTLELGNNGQPYSDDGFHPPIDVLEKFKSKSRWLNSFALNDRESVSSTIIANRKMLICYANSGEVWTPTKGAPEGGKWLWPINVRASDWARRMSTWSITEDMLIGPKTKEQEYGSIMKAQWIGGCCRVQPYQINELARLLKPEEFRPLVTDSTPANEPPESAVSKQNESTSENLGETKSEQSSKDCSTSTIKTRQRKRAKRVPASDRTPRSRSKYRKK